MQEFVSGKIEEVFRATFADEATTAMANPILYGDFLLYNEIEEQKNAGGGDLVRLYEDLTDYATIKPVLNEVRTASVANPPTVPRDSTPHACRSAGAGPGELQHGE